MIYKGFLLAVIENQIPSFSIENLEGDLMNREIGECVGLWLAEGDKKSDREITFTNNCLELIFFFHKSVKTLYNGKNIPRIYIYSSTDRVLISDLQGFNVKNYFDKRAKRTYFIYRLADTTFVKEWKKLVNQAKESSDFYADILRGIFAGEGNIKHDFENNNSRNLRIAAGFRDPFIEKLLRSFDIHFIYEEERRNYLITGRQLEKLKMIQIASLHPEKESKFRFMIECLKEKHYSPGELKQLLFEELHDFRRTSELAIKFGKSDLRILEVLRELKREGKIGLIRLRGISLWTRKEILDEYLSTEKVKLLTKLEKNTTLTAIGKSLNLSRKSVRHRLLKLQLQGVVEKQGDYWMIKEKEKTIVGIDESGSE